MSTAEVFRRVTSALDQAGISHMLTGSFAGAYYGAQRATQDIDLVIEATAGQLRTFVQSLPRDEYYAELDAALEAHERESLFNIIDLKTGWKVDLIIRKSRAFSREEFRRRLPVNLEGSHLYAASAEDVVIAKLEWSKLGQSKRQIQDVAAILRMRGESLDHSYLDKWIRELHLEEQWDDARHSATEDEAS
jgi:hypothetical protein